MKASRFRLHFLGAALLLTACGICGIPMKDLGKIKPGMTPDQVETLLGAPASINHSETADQNLNADVYHYPASNGEGRVVFVNHAVFKAEFVTGAKS